MHLSVLCKYDKRLTNKCGMISANQNVHLPYFSREIKNSLASTGDA